MEGHIVDIEYDDGTCEIACIKSDTGTDYTVSILEYETNGLYKFSDDILTVPKESISGFYDTTSLYETGLYTKVDEVYYEAVDESDPDVVYYSSDESESDSEVSLCDEDEDSD
jgi:predicted choloylglycine hydrolase